MAPISNLNNKRGTLTNGKKNILYFDGTNNKKINLLKKHDILN